jgi:hypothetical protein
MQIWNQTPFPSEFTMGMDVAAREYLVLVVKGTFAFPNDPGGPVRPAAEQAPLVMADTFTGEPGFSATRWETDFAFRKARCDVVLNGSAHAPGSRPAEHVRVGLKVGAWSKTLDVFGHREWRSLGPAFVATRPLPFLRQPITYDHAWGGTDRLDPDDPLPGAYLRNPVGTGWAQPRNQSRIPGLRLPATQAPGETITSPFGEYTPASFGPMGRGWPGRIEYGGTYDQAWIDDVFPFLPADFDERYFQMAPPDQQIDSPRAGTDVQLVGLTTSGREQFRLPLTELPITLFRGRETAFDGSLQPDTLLFDTDARILCLVWRLQAPIRRTILDYTEAWIGRPTEAMLRARREGRRYIRAAGVEPEPEDAA